MSTACVHVKFAAIQALPPIGKQKRYSPQLLTYIQAVEIDRLRAVSRSTGSYVTNLPVGDFAIAIEKLEWYALRWKAEVFHKVMKSGCRAEEARLETAERLTKFLALVAIVSRRSSSSPFPQGPEDAPEPVLTSTEITTLDAIDAARQSRVSFVRPSPPTCSRPPCWAATSRVTTIPRQEIWSCGEA